MFSRLFRLGHDIRCGRCNNLHRHHRNARRTISDINKYDLTKNKNSMELLIKPSSINSVSVDVKDNNYEAKFRGWVKITIEGETPIEFIKKDLINKNIEQKDILSIKYDSLYRLVNLDDIETDYPDEDSDGTIDIDKTNNNIFDHHEDTFNGLKFSDEDLRHYPQV